MADVKELAEKAARARRDYDLMSATNVDGMAAEDLVALDARVKLVYDAYVKADSAYRQAIEALSSDELLALANG